MRMAIGSRSCGSGDGGLGYARLLRRDEPSHAEPPAAELASKRAAVKATMPGLAVVVLTEEVRDPAVVFGAHGSASCK